MVATRKHQEASWTQRRKKSRTHGHGSEGAGRNEILVRIRYNENLEMSHEEASNFEKAAGGGDHVDLEFHLRNTEKGKLELAILKYLLPLILLLALLLLLLLFIRNKKRSTSTLPRPPFRLPKKSQTILQDMSKEIVANNPMVWCVLNRPLIWRYSEKDSASSIQTQQRGDVAFRSTVPDSMSDGHDKLPWASSSTESRQIQRERTYER
ncbi:hypothetical protein OSTOST_18962 [Ostertagia ostertagi]